MLVADVQLFVLPLPSHFELSFDWAVSLSKKKHFKFSYHAATDDIIEARNHDR